MRHFTAYGLMAVASVAQAQVTIGVGEVDEEVVVLGTREQGYRATVAPLTNKSDTPIKETPFSVQVVTHELIRDRGITTVGEALRYVPGLSPQVGFGASNDRFYIRGFITPYNLKNSSRTWSRSKC
jgi:iron complex outermembrane receptor protein